LDAVDSLEHSVMRVKFLPETSGMFKLQLISWTYTHALRGAAELVQVGWRRRAIQASGSTFVSNKSPVFCKCGAEVDA